MSTDNKMLFRQFIEEVANQGNIAAIDELLVPNFISHEELPPGIPAGREGAKVLFTMLRSAFPDLQVAIEDQIAEEDKVVARTTWRGTHPGEFLGIPPTGKPVKYAVIDIVRIAEGKIVEHWAVVDMLGLMQQLGMIPQPGQGAR
jgi:steroid delta-isomerase-like uncharacterized protein